MKKCDFIDEIVVKIDEKTLNLRIKREKNDYNMVQMVLNVENFEFH